MKKWVISLALLLSACATQQAATPPTTDGERLLDSGLEHLATRSNKQAIADFDKVIALCENQYANSGKKVYASRGTAETLYYMTKAAADNESAIAVGPLCSDAYYLRGYASLDLGQIELAQDYINKAIDMAPVNSLYLSEMGHIYHSRSDWQAALEIFTRAEQAANTYSPPELKQAELTRAKRGVGYSLIELGKLDEAEQQFRECLQINQNDEGAMAELEYIEQVRSNGPEEF